MCVLSTNEESVNNEFIKPIQVHNQHDAVEEVSQYALQVKTAIFSQYDCVTLLWW